MAEGFAVWVVGLPGSGKSNLARAVAEALVEWGYDAVHLQMDERRKVYFPHPQYTAAEREDAYRLFAEEAAGLAAQGLAVVMDGSAYKVAFREHARALIPKFCEIYVQCSLETAIARETKRPQGLVKAKLYQQALERQATGVQVPGLGEVIGVDVPFEENPAAEFLINNENIPKAETRDLTLAFLRAWLSEFGLTPPAG
jgi:adenylylsulfate kinase